jgi:hypothetical protein
MTPTSIAIDEYSVNLETQAKADARHAETARPLRKNRYRLRLIA